MNKEHEAKENRLSPELLAGIILALFFGVALYLRVYLPYDQVFSGEWIKFTGVDAYYHMRLVDNLVHNFPQLINFDPYSFYPYGGQIDNIHFFDWLLAGIIWVIGLGSPTPHTIDVIGVYFPAVLAALTVIPVYFIGKELFGRWAGVLSAGLIALLPGEFLGRSILGFTDHHIAETLFTATAMMFLILAIKASRERGLTFSHLWHRDWATISKPVIYSLLAGLFLGIYLITWMGALLFIFIISVYFFIQFVIAHLKRQSTDYLGPVGVILFLTALIIYLPFMRGLLYLLSLGVALLIPVVLSGVSQLMIGKRIRLAYYPLTLVGLGVVVLAIFYAITPSLFQAMLYRFSIFTWSGTRTIIEMQPLLRPVGDWTLAIAWGNFTTGFFLSLISLGFLIWYFVIKQGSAEKSLLVVWSLIILAATLGQRRFAYYFAVNIALLTGYLSVIVCYIIRFIIDYLGGKSTDYMSWQILEFAGFKELIARPVELPTRAERKRGKLKKGQWVRPTINYTSIGLWVIVIFFLVFYPNIKPAVGTASQVRFAPPDAWINSLTWLKENTPEPFGDPDFYYQLYEPPPPEESYNYPESAYGVMAWGDYGYWITRIAHRPVNLTPGPGGAEIANFFLSQDEESANKIIQELDSSYIIIDDLTAINKFWALASWAEREITEFVGMYHLRREDKLVPINLFHPEYYRSLVARLYNFDGQTVTPRESIVISYEERVIQEGGSIRLITDVQVFPSYEEATAYVSSQKSGSYRIVGDNPFVSSVPLEELKYYKLIHSSDELVTQPGVGSLPSVKIFEYIK